MRILHVLDHSIPLQSGYTFRTRNILREQHRRGWETCHVTGLKQVGASAAEEDCDGLHFYRTLASQSLAEKTPVINQLHVINSLQSRICEVIEQEKPDIVHAHSPALNGVAALRAASKFGLPVVYECRAFWEDAAVDHGTSSEGGLRYRLTRAMETSVFKRADGITTICEGLRQDIVARGIPDSKVVVIPNAVDVDSFSMDSAPDEALREKLGLQGKSVLGFIGSFYAYEGLPLLLDALPAVLAEVPDLALLLVGGGPDEHRIDEKISGHCLEEHVVRTGRVPHSEVHSYYDLVDIFVYPRLAMRLTELVTPLKPLEAMAQGKIVTASDIGGHRELIENGRNGYLFEPDSPTDLARALAGILSRKEEWPALRRAGRDFVEMERNWQNSVSRYQALYERLL